MRFRRLIAGCVVALSVMTSSACAQSVSAPAPALASTPAPLPLLVSSPTPGLAEVTVAVTSQSLQSEGTVKGVADELTAAGFVAGRQRTFQGPSKDLTLIRDRELLFSSAEGANAYLNSVRTQSTAYFGEATGATAFTHGSRAGTLFVPPECACHGANPVLTAVLTDGPRLSWVTINGPMATKQRLQEVLSQPTRP